MNKLPFTVTDNGRWPEDEAYLVILSTSNINREDIKSDNEFEEILIKNCAKTETLFKNRENEKNLVGRFRQSINDILKGTGIEIYDEGLNIKKVR